MQTTCMYILSDNSLIPRSHAAWERGYSDNYTAFHKGRVCLLKAIICYTLLGDT